MAKRRAAVITPFVDKRHGSERWLAECVSRLASEYEIHIYSQRVEDVDLQRIIWHPVPEIPGPQLIKYLWWFIVNHVRRWCDRRFRGLHYDLVYSPGINCLNADIVTVHIVFDAFFRCVREELRLRRNPVRSWPRLIHRCLYYRLIRVLEHKIYPNPSLVLSVVSQKVAEEVCRLFGRRNLVRVVYPGIDIDVFNPEARLRRRPKVRCQLGIADDEFVLLLIGNGWKNKGLHCLLEAMARLRDLPLKLLVVGEDDQVLFKAMIEKLGLRNRVRFLLPSPDVMQFYAAADLYVSPSLHDSFALPPAEAMACALPVITSSANGGSEVMTHLVDALILPNPRDAGELARLIRWVQQDPELRSRISRNAQMTARRYTWERSINEMRLLFQDVMKHKAVSNRPAVSRSRV